MKTQTEKKSLWRGLCECVLGKPEEIPIENTGRIHFIPCGKAPLPKWALRDLAYREPGVYSYATDYRLRATSNTDPGLWVTGETNYCQWLALKCPVELDFDAFVDGFTNKARYSTPEYDTSTPDGLARFCGWMFWATRRSKVGIPLYEVKRAAENKDCLQGYLDDEIEEESLLDHELPGNMRFYHRY